TDHVPESIIAQCAMYMSIINCGRWDVAALIGGFGLKFYQIYRNLELEEVIIEKLKTFWFDHVKKGVPPESKTLDDVDMLYRYGDLDTIESIPEIYACYKELLEIVKQCKSLETKKNDIKLKIKEYMGNHQALSNFGDQIIITWIKDQDSKKFDKEAFRSDYPELFEKYQKTKIGSRRFLPKEIK
ncbi:MAG: hypothetical protein JSU85_01265, partial [Candidatus Zixiibacteriota bacterium]